MRRAVRSRPLLLRPELGVLLCLIGGCVAASKEAGRDIIGPLSATLTSNVEKADRVENKVESNAVKIDGLHAEVNAMKAETIKMGDPIQTIISGVIGLATLAGIGWLVRYLLQRAACRYQ